MGICMPSQRIKAGQLCEVNGTHDWSCISDMMVSRVITRLEENKCQISDLLKTHPDFGVGSCVRTKFGWGQVTAINAGKVTVRRHDGSHGWFDYEVDAYTPAPWHAPMPKSKAVEATAKPDPKELKRQAHQKYIESFGKTGKCTYCGRFSGQTHARNCTNPDKVGK